MVMTFDVATMKIVKVIWTDCEKHEDGWLTEEAVIEYIDQPLKVMRSVGWLICDDERWVIIAQSAGNDRDGFTASEIVKIPRAMVDNMVILSPQIACYGASPDLKMKIKFVESDGMPDGMEEDKPSRGRGRMKKHFEENAQAIGQGILDEFFTDDEELPTVEGGGIVVNNVEFLGVDALDDGSGMVSVGFTGTIDDGK